MDKLEYLSRYELYAKVDYIFDISVLILLFYLGWNTAWIIFLILFIINQFAVAFRQLKLREQVGVQ